MCPLWLATTKIAWAYRPGLNWMPFILHMRAPMRSTTSLRGTASTWRMGVIIKRLIGLNDANGRKTPVIVTPEELLEVPDDVRME